MNLELVEWNPAVLEREDYAFMSCNLVRLRHVLCLPPTADYVLVHMRCVPYILSRTH